MTMQPEQRVLEPEDFIRQIVFPVAPVERALGMITSVHKLFASENLRTYHRRFRGLSSGCYHRGTEEIALYGPSPRAELTFIHEYGHFLDFTILSETSRACSCTPQSKLSGIIKMLRQTPTYAGICHDEA